MDQDVFDRPIAEHTGLLQRLIIQTLHGLQHRFTAGFEGRENGFLAHRIGLLSWPAGEGRIDPGVDPQLERSRSLLLPGEPPAGVPSSTDLLLILTNRDACRTHAVLLPASEVCSSRPGSPPS